MAVCGTPGTGKTRILNAFRDDDFVFTVTMSEAIKEHKLYSEYDDEMGAYVMDECKVKKFVQKLIGSLGRVASCKALLIETHTPSVLPKRKSHAIVLQCDTHVLYDRLKARGYHQKKCEENVQAEIMQVVWEEAVERFGEKKVKCFVNNTLEDHWAVVDYIREQIADYEKSHYEKTQKK